MAANRRNALARVGRGSGCSVIKASIAAIKDGYADPDGPGSIAIGRSNRRAWPNAVVDRVAMARRVDLNGVRIVLTRLA